MVENSHARDHRKDSTTGAHVSHTRTCTASTLGTASVHVAPRTLALKTLTRADAAHLSRAVAKSVAYTHERPAAAGTGRADERGRLLRARARTKGAARRAPMPKA